MKVSYSRIKAVGDNPPEPVDFTQDYAEKEMLSFIFSNFSRKTDDKPYADVDEYLIETYNNVQDKEEFKQIVQSALNEIMGMTVAEIDPLLFDEVGKKIHRFFKEAYGDILIKDLIKQKKRILSEPESSSMSISNVKPLTNQEMTRYIKELEYKVGISEGKDTTSKTIILNELENNDFDENKSVENRSVVSFEDFRTNEKPKNKIEKLLSLGFSEFNLDEKTTEVVSLKERPEPRPRLKDIENSLRFHEDYQVHFEKIEIFTALAKGIGFAVMRAMYISYNIEFRENIIKLLDEGKILGQAYSEVNSKTAKQYPLENILRAFKGFAKAYSTELSDKFESDLRNFEKQRQVDRNVGKDETPMGDVTGRNDLIDILSEEYENIISNNKTQFRDMTARMQDMIKGLKGEISLGALSSLNETEIELGGEKFGLGEILSLRFKDLPKEDDEEVKIVERKDERPPKLILEELEKPFKRIDEIDEILEKEFESREKKYIKKVKEYNEAYDKWEDSQESNSEEENERLYKKFYEEGLELDEEQRKLLPFKNFVKDARKAGGKYLPQFLQTERKEKDNKSYVKEFLKDVPLYERPLKIFAPPSFKEWGKVSYLKEYTDLQKEIKKLQAEYKDKIKVDKVPRNRINLLREKMEEEGYYKDGNYTKEFLKEAEYLLLELNDEEVEAPIKALTELKDALERNGVKFEPVASMIDDLNNARPIDHNSIKEIDDVLQRAIKTQSKLIKDKFEKSNQTEEKKKENKESSSEKAKKIFESISFDGKSLKLGKLLLEMRGNQYLRDPRGLYQFTIKVTERNKKDGGKSYLLNSHKVSLVREINTKRLPSAIGQGESVKRRQRTRVGTEKFREVADKQSFARFVDASVKLDDLEAALTEMI